MLDKIKRLLGISITEQDNYLYDTYDIKSIGKIVIPEQITDKNAFTLANSVAELFFPIDFYADRISKLRFYIADKNGVELENSEFNRFINKINPLYSFSDLVYQYVFSLLADGNVYNYIQAPNTYKNLTVNSINRWDVLRPDLLTIEEFTNISSLDINELKSAIKKAEYNEYFKSKLLEIDRLKIHNYSSNKRNSSVILSKSPQFSANKSIDTLLSVYSARYNVYANNGAAGYLASKAANTTGNMQMDVLISGQDKRQKILDDINARNGLTGKRNIWGISGVPIEFVRTLATISELMPFDETLECSIKIASVFQIPPVLVPRKDQSTYDNQSDAERNVWENAISSLLKTVCENITSLFMLNTLGLSIKADTSGVSCLTTNEGTKEDLKTKKISNSTLMYEKGIITYNEMLISLGLEPIPDGDKYIYDMTKTPYAVKLGVGGIQAMQVILTDANMAPDMKRNTLVVIFGLTEQEAKLIVP